MLREDVRLFDNADRRLGRVGLTVVEWDRSNVAARGGLANGIGTGLAAYGRDQRERVPRIDEVVNAVRCGPIDEPRGVGSDVVVLQSRADARRGQQSLHILCKGGELGGWDHIDRMRGSKQRRIACRAFGGARTVAVLVAAETVGAVRGAESLRRRVVDILKAGRGEIAVLLGQGREGHRRRGRAGIAEAVVVAEVEDLLFPCAKRD